VLTKIFSQIGEIREGGLLMPQDESKTTLGYAFVEFATEQQAQSAVEQTNGYKLDKSHIFKVCKFDDFEKYTKVPDEYAAPAPKPFTQRENTQAWMMDQRGRDQFVCRFGDETEIFWNDPQTKKGEEVYRRSFWTESYVQWSPKGSFLATVHRQGVALWGGESFGRIAKYGHNGVQFIEFSPCERYLATGSTHEPTKAGETTTVVVNFFDTRSGAKLRQFMGPISDFIAQGQQGLTWPVFKWSGQSSDESGAFFAKIGTGMISVYQAPDMTLVDKKSIKLEGVVDFCWSPADPILAAFQPEQGGGNQPARLSLIQLPNKNEVRSKNLFNVVGVSMYWQSSGDYFAAKILRTTKSKKSTYSGFELFRLREPNCPMEVLELPNKAEKIVAFAWEPKGHRFAVIHGDGARPDVSFYTMKDKNGKNNVTLIGTIKNKTANHLFWSPNGRVIILAGLKTMNGQFEFFDVDTMDTMATVEHFMATDVEWDPTGRFVTTAVTSVHQMENGYHMWTFNGKLLYKYGKDRFFQFVWRPRGKSLLSPEQEREIEKNIKKYSKKFEEIDEKIRNQADSNVASAKKAQEDKWKNWVAAKKAAQDTEAFKSTMNKLLGAQANAHLEVVETTVVEEEIISINEEPL
jgi:translation initiation factor 3 subunit B